MTTKIIRNIQRMERRVAALGPHRAAVVHVATGSDRRASQTLRMLRASGHPVAVEYAALVAEARAWRWGSCMPYPTHHKPRRTRR